MKKLEEKIIQALKGSKGVDQVIEDLSQSSQNLLKNATNPAFSSADKNKIIKRYTQVLNLERSLNRYKSLVDNGYSDDAQSQKEEIETLLLKGGVSYNNYVWHSENGENTCDECKALDGKVFESSEEVPNRPHPNCRCTVEILEGDNKISSPEPSEDEEPCDCWEKIDEMVEDIQNLQNEIEPLIFNLENIVSKDVQLLDEIKYLKQKIKDEQSDLINVEPCGDNCVAYITGMAVQISDDSKLEKWIYNLTKYNKAARESFVIFLMTKHEMEIARDGMDKYYHAKANCKAAELSEMHAKWAILWSKLKEIKDFLYKTMKLHMNVIDVYEDCKRDLNADKYGIWKAKEHGNCSEKVKNVYKDVFGQK